MKIILANNYFYFRGGAERYFFEVGDLLKSKGHKIIRFSAYHEKNNRTLYSKYFIDKSSVYSDRLDGQISLLGKIRIALNSIYSIEAKKKICELIKDTKPDLIHIHGIPYRLTSSIIDGAKDLGVPVVQTCHEYKTMCPNQRLYNLYARQICEECKGERYYKMIRKRCIKGSYGASLIGCLEAYLCSIKKIYRWKIDHFVTPSNFMQKKMVEFGFSKERISHISNFVFADKYLPAYNNNGYILYYGHFTPQKGLHTLIKALKPTKNIPAKIVGEGYIGEDLRRIKDKYDMTNIDILDFLEGNRLNEVIRNCCFTIITSEWYENSPMTIYESFAMGKPVIGSNIGGIPELIEDGVTGLLFETGNAKDLAEKINWLFSKPEKIVEMGKNARRKVEDEYNEEIHYNRLIEVYKRVLNNRNEYESTVN